jgi:hypothetical protein
LGTGSVGPGPPGFGFGAGSVICENEKLPEQTTTQAVTSATHHLGPLIRIVAPISDDRSPGRF